MSKLSSRNNNQKNKDHNESQIKFLNEKGETAYGNSNKMSKISSINNNENITSDSMFLSYYRWY